MITKIGLPQATIDKIRNFNSTIGLQKVETNGTEAALRGNTETSNNWRTKSRNAPPS